MITKLKTMNNRILIFFAALLLLLTGCVDKEINFHSERLTVFVGDLIDLDYSTNIDEDRIDDIRIEFDDGSLVDLKKDGSLSAAKEGTLTASIIYKDKTYDTEEIIIEPVICQDIFSPDYKIEIGRETETDITYYPENSTHQDYVLISDDETVFTVHGNKIVGVSSGEALLTIRSVDGPEKTVNVSVFPVEADKVIIKNLQKKYITGSEADLRTDFEPSDTTDKTVTWSSSDERVASVDQDGRLKAIRPGMVTIKAIGSNGVEDQKQIEITYPKVSSISLSANYSSIYVDDRLGIRAELEPEKVDDDFLTWRSSNTDIATVNDEGVVTAIAEGTVTIYATASNGINGSYKIKISKRPSITRNSSGSSGSTGSGSYCLNLNTKKFHRASCGDIKKMKESNKQYTDADRDTIIGWGYSPCGHCKP